MHALSTVLRFLGFTIFDESFFAVIDGSHTKDSTQGATDRQSAGEEDEDEDDEEMGDLEDMDARY
jgi:hypothetical protein